MRVETRRLRWWRWEAFERLTLSGGVVAYGRTRRGAVRNLDRLRGRRG